MPIVTPDFHRMEIISLKSLIMRNSEIPPHAISIGLPLALSSEFRSNYDEINWSRGKSSIKEQGRLDELDLEVSENKCKYATLGPKSAARKSNRRGNVLDRIRQKKIK